MTAPEPRYPYVHVHVPPEASELVASELWDLGAEGIEERDSTTLDHSTSEGTVTLVAFFPEEELARSVVRGYEGRYEAQLLFVVGDAWRESWKEYFHPSRVGAHLVIRPSWEQVKLWPGEVMLTIDPDRAFGSGTHETTRLVLRELDRRICGGERLLDVGCGSGILSIGATLLGARDAVAIDTDPAAVANTVENARANDMAARIHASTTPVEEIEGRFDMVVANIQAHVLIPLADAIGDRVADEGTLVLSGILREQWKEVRAAYPGFDCLLVPAEGEWTALVLERKRVRPTGGDQS